MKYLIAVVVGFFSGLTVFILTTVHLTSDPSVLDWFRDYKVLIFIGPWTLSTLSLLFRAKQARDVLKRSFLLGAVLWLLMIPVYQKTVATLSTADPTAVAIYAIPLFLAIVCLGGFILIPPTPPVPPS